MPLLFLQDGSEILEVSLSDTLQPGLASFEVQTGCLLSEPMHILVCPTADLAKELSGISGSAGLEAIVQDLGLLIGEANSAAKDGYIPLASR